MSGGGYRGLFTASVIESLEVELARRVKESEPFGGRFDLIAGTSIGGIFAGALTYGIPGAALKAVLRDRGNTIFPPMRLRGLRKMIGKSPYDPEKLKDAIKVLIPTAATDLLGDRPQALLMTSVNYTTSRLHILGSAPTPHRDKLRLSMLDAMLATSAAPAHFPAHTVDHQIFLDGGLAANAPDLLALRCAESMYPNADISMLSIGTANLLHGRDPSKVPTRGLKWAGPAIQIAMNVQEMQAVDQCREELGDRYVRLSIPPSASQAKRVDFDVANATSTSVLLNLADECVGSLSMLERNRLMALLR